MVLVLGIVKASLEILGIGIGVKKVVLLMSDVEQNRGHYFNWEVWGFMVELVKSLYPFH